MHYHAKTPAAGVLSAEQRAKRSVFSLVSQAGIAALGIPTPSLCNAISDIRADAVIHCALRATHKLELSNGDVLLRCFTHALARRVSKYQHSADVVKTSTLPEPIEHTCPWCGYRFDASTSMREKREPRPGDWSLCIRCVQLFRFGPELAPRIPTLPDLADLENDGELTALIDRTRRALEEFGGSRGAQ